MNNINFYSKVQSLNEKKPLQKSAFSMAAAVTMAWVWPCPFTQGTLLNLTAHLATRGKVPFNLPMVATTTIATLWSATIYKIGADAAQATAAAVGFAVSNPDKVAQFALDAFGQAVPHLTVPAILFTAVALSNPKTQPQYKN